MGLGEALEAGIHRQDHVGQPEIGEGGDDADEAVAGGAPEPAVQHAAARLEHGPPGVGLDQVARPERHQHERDQDAAPPRRDDARHDEGERNGDEQELADDLTEAQRPCVVINARGRVVVSSEPDWVVGGPGARLRVGGMVGRGLDAGAGGCRHRGSRSGMDVPPV